MRWLTRDLQPGPEFRALPLCLRTTTGQTYDSALIMLLQVLHWMMLGSWHCRPVASQMGTSPQGSLRATSRGTPMSGAPLALMPIWRALARCSPRTLAAADPGYYTEWTAAASGTKRGADRVIIGGGPAAPDVIFYWDRSGMYIQVYP